MPRRSRRSRRYEDRAPWWSSEYAGAPVWMIIATALVIIGVLVFALLQRG